MKEVRILTLDNRGRVVIPKIIRHNLGLKTNSQLMLTADSETKEIKITPIGIEGDSYKFRILMRDEAGSLAKIATIFGKLGISLVYGESVILEKGKTAVWTVIAPATDIEFDEIKETLQREGEALDVKILPLD